MYTASFLKCIGHSSWTEVAPKYISLFAQYSVMSVTLTFNIQPKHNRQRYFSKTFWMSWSTVVLTPWPVWGIPRLLDWVMTVLPGRVTSLSRCSREGKDRSGQWDQKQLETIIINNISWKTEVTACFILDLEPGVAPCFNKSAFKQVGACMLQTFLYQPGQGSFCPLCWSTGCSIKILCYSFVFLL